MQSPEDEQKPGVEEDEIFHLLSNARRRMVLRYLTTVNTEAEVSEVAETIAAWENDKPPDEVAYNERKSVYVSLIQNHLDKMDSDGVLIYDEDRKTIKATDMTEVVAHYGDLTENDDSGILTQILNLLR